MKEIIFNKKDYKSYKDFYIDICKKMDAKNNLNCLHPIDLGFNGNILNEFLWDYSLDNIHYIFIGFDKNMILSEKNYDNYHYKIIFEIFEDFIKDYPNNSLEFREDENIN